MSIVAIRSNRLQETVSQPRSQGLLAFQYGGSISSLLSQPYWKARKPWRRGWQFNANLVLPVPTERERERRENLGTKQCLKINSNNNTGLLFFWNSTDAKTRLDFLKIKQPNEFRCHTFSMTFVGLSLFLQVCREGHIVSIVWLYLFRPCSPL